MPSKSNLPTRVSLPISEGEVHNALRAIIANREAKALNWAVNYARAGLGLSGQDLKDQCNYVLSNMEHWRGETAREVRAILKNFSPATFAR